VRRGVRLILFALLFIVPTIGWAQEPSGSGALPIEKILDPLPEFNPFDEQVRYRPQYFPDDTDRRIRQALIDSLTDSKKPLQDHVNFFKDKDSELMEERNTVTGLTQHVVDLHNNTITDRQGYLTAQKQAFDSASSEEQKKLIRSRIRNDELAQASVLLRRSKTNRWGSFVNQFLKSVDIVNILSGSYATAAADATLSQLAALRSKEMPFEERKALDLYLQYLKRYPNDPHREEVEKIVEDLQKKKKKALTQQHIKEAEEALDQGELTRAELHYEMAVLIDPESKKAKKGFDKLKERMKKEGDERQKSFSLPDKRIQSNRIPIHDAQLINLLYALALRNPKSIEAYAKAIEKRYPGSSIGESAREARVVALEIQGKHEAAKKMLKKIARSSKSPEQRKRAMTLLESPEYNKLALLHKAQKQRQLDTIRYVLLGENFLEKNLLLSLRPFIYQGVGGASTMGIANLIFVSSNLLHVLSADPISNQPIIDKGVAYIRSHPDSESATDVYQILAKAYEDVGAYDKAIAYYKLSDKASEEKISKLTATAASALLQRAEKSQSNRTKELYLRLVLDLYPESAASKEAIGKLAQLVKLENRGTSISKKFLMEYPELYNLQGLGLKSTLFDGNPNNMELADNGLNLLNKSEIMLHFETPWGFRSKAYLVRTETIERFQRALRKRHYDIALDDVHVRAKESPGGITQLPSEFLTVKRDRKASESDNTNLTLVKRVGGDKPPTFQKVLDYKLLTENEKNGGGIFRLPPLQGSVSTGGFNLSGNLPESMGGDKFSLGTDGRTPMGGLQLPIPLLQDFIPVDFLLQGSTGRPSLIPQIHRYRTKEDKTLYR